MSLPPDVSSMHEGVIVGPVLLSLECVWDMTLADEERRTPPDQRAVHTNRMLKLRMTDGQQAVSGIEYRRLNNLSDATPPGTHVLVHNVVVRRGLLLLTPSCANVAAGAPGAITSTAPPASGAPLAATQQVTLQLPPPQMAQAPQQPLPVAQLPQMHPSQPQQWHPQPPVQPPPVKLQQPSPHPKQPSPPLQLPGSKPSPPALPVPPQPQQQPYQPVPPSAAQAYLPPPPPHVHARLQSPPPPSMNAHLPMRPAPSPPLSEPSNPPQAAQPRHDACSPAPSSSAVGSSTLPPAAAALPPPPQQQYAAPGAAPAAPALSTSAPVSTVAASSAAIPGYFEPGAAAVPEMSLRAACTRYDHGELLLLAHQRVRVRASSTRLTKFSVEQGVCQATVQLIEVDGVPGPDAYTRELPLAPGLLPFLESLLGQSSENICDMMCSEDRAVKRIAKTGIRNANNHFEGLEGAFVLGGGPSGLTVHELP